MDDQTRQLLDKSQQYLRSAAVLLEVGDYDSCTSRTYFAMFYAAQAALLTANISVGNRRSVRSAFVERFVDNGRFPRRAGDVLHRAYELQETADYAQRPVVEEDEAEQALSEAEAFIGSIDALIPRRSAARDRTAAAPSSHSASASSKKAPDDAAKGESVSGSEEARTERAEDDSDAAESSEDSSNSSTSEENAAEQRTAEA